ncbi:hypothetical protein Trydic_g19331, partial [Trypoxylus dichotomus]
EQASKVGIPHPARNRDTERLQELESHLMRLAFEQLATQAFVHGIRDIEVQQAIRMGRHRKCSNALIHALEFEAAKQASKACPNIGELQVAFELINLKGNSRENRVCWNCGSHIGSDSRATKNGSLCC